MTATIANFIHTSAPQIAKAIQARLTLGRGYLKNPSLERKRQNAIHFLRFESKRGWILDGGPVRISAVQSVHADR